MGRIRQYIEAGDKKLWAMFDSGARNTYVTKEVATHFPTFDLEKPNPVALGGKSHIVTQSCYLQCKVKGFNIDTNARVLESIGTDEEEKSIDILIGALTMQQWGIVLLPEQEDVDMKYYPKEFMEFFEG